MRRGAIPAAPFRFFNRGGANRNHDCAAVANKKVPLGILVPPAWLRTLVWSRPIATNPVRALQIARTKKSHLEDIDLESALRSLSSCAGARTHDVHVLAALPPRDVAPDVHQRRTVRSELMMRVGGAPGVPVRRHLSFLVGVFVPDTRVIRRSRARSRAINRCLESDRLVNLMSGLIVCCLGDR